MKKIKVPLIIEKSDDDEIFGRVNYDENLIVDSATSLEKLKKKFEKLLKTFHQLKADEIDFDIQYGDKM